VERREAGAAGPWVRCNDYAVIDPEFTVDGLVEMRDYEFRVIATNQMGRGEPSPPTSPIKIQESGGSRPEIVRKLFDLPSPLNKRVTFECEAIGRPIPMARW